MYHFLKVFIEFVTKLFVYLFVCLFCIFLAHKAYGILVSGPGVEPTLNFTFLRQNPNHCTIREVPWNSLIHFKVRGNISKSLISFLPRVSNKVSGFLDQLLLLYRH